MNFFPVIKRKYKTTLHLEEFVHVCDTNPSKDIFFPFFSDPIIIRTEENAYLVSRQYKKGGHDTIATISHSSDTQKFQINVVYTKPPRMLIAIMAMFLFVCICLVDSSNPIEEKKEAILYLSGFSIFFYLFLILIHYNNVSNLETFIESKFDCKKIDNGFD